MTAMILEYFLIACGGIALLLLAGSGWFRWRK